MATSEKGSETKETSLREYEMLSAEEETPPWALALFNKMKSEICAEVTAKVAYSVRIMLDHFGEEMKTTLEAYHAKNVGEESQCSCKDPKKCQSCKEKRALLRASHYALKKEEKKAAKMAYKESKKLRNKYFKSSGSESETEIPAQPGFSSIKSPVVKYDTTKAPPVPPRNISPGKVVGLSFAPLLEASALPEATVREHIVNIAVDSEPKIINGSSAQLDELLEATATSKTDLAANAEKITCDQPLNPSLMHAESYPSPSDSEFEVVSMPSHMNVAPELNRGMDDYPSISDYEDDSSSSSGDDNETETEMEFNCRKNLSAEALKDLQSKGSLYPELELKKMTLSMASSTSTFIDDYMSTWSMEGAVGGVATTGNTYPVTSIDDPLDEKKQRDESADHSGTVERQRSPYSVTPEEVEKINTQEIVHNQPLPSEFLRDRSPYSSEAPPEQAANQQQRNGNIPTTPAPKPQPQQQQKASKQRTDRDSRTYHVDSLPESLWDEALTVAAQTYNAAKAAVENLADTFVPGAPPSPSRIVIAEQAAAASKPQPRNVPPPVASINRPKNMTRLEERLFEMGFTNHVLNSTLLARHNQDIEKVIAELLDP